MVGLGRGRTYITTGRNRSSGNGGYSSLTRRETGCMRRIGRRVFIRRGIRDTCQMAIVGEGPLEVAVWEHNRPAEIHKGQP